MSTLVELCTPEREELAARAALSPAAYGFVAGAAGRETTVAANRRGWDSVRLTHRLPVDVTTRSTRSTMFGCESAAPLAVAPMGALDAVAVGGDLDIARACATAGVPMVVSTMSSTAVEDIAATGANLVFQLYALRDKKAQRDLIRRAESAGCHALVITIDTPMRHGSIGETVTGFELAAPTAHFPAGGAEIDPALTMDEIAAVIGETRLPVWVKGVLHPLHADRALRAGARGVIVSNHGGRQSDAAPATAHVLPSVVAAVRESPIEAGVVADSGIATGTDLVRALALGASGVLIGRPVAYAVAARGERGVLSTLTRLRDELDVAMACNGCAYPADAELLAR